MRSNGFATAALQVCEISRLKSEPNHLTKRPARVYVCAARTLTLAVQTHKFFALWLMPNIIFNPPHVQAR